MLFVWGLLLIGLPSTISASAPPEGQFGCIYDPVFGCNANISTSTCNAGYAHDDTLCAPFTDQASCNGQIFTCVCAGGSCPSCYRWVGGNCLPTSPPNCEYATLTDCQNSNNPSQDYICGPGFVCTPVAASHCTANPGTCMSNAECLNNCALANPGTTGSPFCPVGSNPRGGVSTALGCIPVEGREFFNSILRWGTAVGAGIAFLLIVYAGFLMVTSGGDPKRVAAGRELLTAALGGLILIALSVVLLNFIGLNILNLGNLGFNL